MANFELQYKASVCQQRYVYQFLEGPPPQEYPHPEIRQKKIYNSKTNTSIQTAFFKIKVNNKGNFSLQCLNVSQKNESGRFHADLQNKNIQN